MPFLDLPDRVQEVRGRIEAAAHRGGHGQPVTIVAVTKTHGPDAVVAAYDAGLRDVGENRVQEALPKMDAVDVPVRWHLIGHLQRNKLKALSRFDLLHSLDSHRLAEAVNEFGCATGRCFDVLVEVNVSGEATKSGFPAADVPALAEQLVGMQGLRVSGVMTMAPIDADDCTLHTVFQGGRRARDVLAEAGHPATMLSMGMSNDFEIAVEEGATCVRLGTILFGARST